jgi:hypothetical protein
MSRVWALDESAAAARILGYRIVWMEGMHNCPNVGLELAKINRSSIGLELRRGGCAGSISLIGGMFMFNPAKLFARNYQRVIISRSAVELIQTFRLGKYSPQAER